MKNRLKIGVLTLLGSLLMTVWAVEPVKSYKDIPLPERNARLITEAMTRELGLTEKQSKKVYKIQLAEQKKIFKYMPTPQRGEVKDFGERPPRGPRMGGGRPPMGGGFEGRGPGHGPMPPHEMIQEEQPDPAKVKKELDKAAEKRDKKLKKALTAEQYALWKTMEEEQMKRLNPMPHLDGPKHGPKEVRFDLR